MRYGLRTLLIWATIGPPLLAMAWWTLPHVLPFAAALYFAAATVYFAVWWTTICHRAEEATRLKLRSAANPGTKPPNSKFEIQSAK
jgi:hypothetical protein